MVWAMTSYSVGYLAKVKIRYQYNFVYSIDLVKYAPCVTSHSADWWFTVQDEIIILLSHKPDNEPSRIVSRAFLIYMLLFVKGWGRQR